MKIRILTATLLALLGLSTANAESVNYLGKTVNLVLPPGECLVGDTPDELAIRKSVQEQTAGSNHVLAAFANCTDLERIRAGKGAALASFGSVLASTPQGQPRTMNGMSRASYLRFLGGNNALAEISFEKAKKQLRERGQPLESAQSFGIVKTDAFAAYFLMRMELPDMQDKPVASTGVVSITAIRDLPLSMNLYRRASGESTAIEMLSTQAETMKKFVEANP